jgi:hypothetical protein
MSERKPRKPAASTPGTWADLRGILKGKTNGARLSIEEINEATAGARATADLAGTDKTKDANGLHVTHATRSNDE